MRRIRHLARLAALLLPLGLSACIGIAHVGVETSPYVVTRVDPRGAAVEVWQVPFYDAASHLVTLAGGQPDREPEPGRRVVLDSANRRAVLPPERRYIGYPATFPVDFFAPSEDVRQSQQLWVLCRRADKVVRLMVAGSRVTLAETSLSELRGRLPALPSTLPLPYDAKTRAYLDTLIAFERATPWVPSTRISARVVSAAALEIGVSPDCA